MTWNTSLATEVGSVIAREARAVGINRGLCPVLQVITDCRFCRMPESFGEDPTHVSTMGAAMTRGLGGGGGGPSTYLPLDRLQTEAKHFAGCVCAVRSHLH
jgi:beta-glucosidase-like glycosyl hydrolase